MGPNSVYNMSLALRILGNVDVDVLARCLKEIYCRHETLRTRFETYEDSAIQIIDPPLLELEVETVFAKDQFELIYQSERETQFDLSKDKLSRIRLIFDKSIQDENNYVLLVTMHHSVSDGWSLGIFYRELVTLYHAYKNDEPSPLAPLAIQYADYAQWQREYLPTGIPARYPCGAIASRRAEESKHSILSPCSFRDRGGDARGSGVGAAGGQARMGAYGRGQLARVHR